MAKIGDYHRRTEAVLAYLDHRGGETGGKHDAQKLLQELDSYRSELEVQNQELRRAQLELRQANERYRELYDFAPVGYLTLDAKGTIRNINIRGADLLDSERHGVLGHSLLKFVEAQSHETLLAHLKQAQTAAVRMSCELKLKCRGATSIFVKMETACNRDPVSGKITFCSTVSDITECKLMELQLVKARDDITRKYAEQRSQCTRAEALLQRRQEALEAIYAISTAPTAAVDVLLERASVAVARILNAPFICIALFNENLVASSVQVQHGKEVSFQLDALVFESGVVQQAIAERRTQQFCGEMGSVVRRWTLQRISSEGTCIVAPIVGHLNSVAGIVLAADLTRNFEDYEIYLIEIFAHYIAGEIIRQAMEKRIVQAEQMKLLGQLTSGVAHEVRNPLCAITALVEALSLETGGKRKYLPYFGHLQDQVNRLSRLMEDLLTLGRSPSAALRARTALLPLVEHCVDSLRFSSQFRHSLVLRTTEGAKELYLRVDPKEIEQVLVNLIDNACHHAPVSSPVEIVLGGPAQGHAVIRVTDRGSGIDPKHLPCIFEPFFTTRKDGSGLGLSIVKHLVESYEGSVCIRNNQAGAGATAEVRLPLIEEN